MTDAIKRYLHAAESVNLNTPPIIVLSNLIGQDI